MISFNHFNFNVLDLEKSLKFYEEALGLAPVREKVAADGSFKLVYLGDGTSSFTLELTYLRDRKEPYNLGECEFHLAFTADEYDVLHEKHKDMGVICYENLAMGIYFISDPDGYWIEIVPVRKEKSSFVQPAAETQPDCGSFVSNIEAVPKDFIWKEEAGLVTKLLSEAAGGEGNCSYFL